MFSVTVRDHVMIAHSFRGEVFGPAQRLHGATYAVELELRRRELDGAGLIADIGQLIQLLKDVLEALNYRNLDEVADFKGRNTTTEFLAYTVFDRARQRIAAGALGPDAPFHSMKIVLRESPVAWAAYEAPLT